MKITVLGCRGSVPSGGSEYAKYGSDTSCYLLESDREALFLDAGTGIVRAPEIEGKEISLAFSHFHLDHVCGLTFFPYLSKDNPVKIFGSMPAIEIELILNRLFTPPFWPTDIASYRADVSYYSLGTKTKLGDLTIKTMRGKHPNGAVILRVEEGDKSFVYATDYEYSKEGLVVLAEFSKGADLIVYDGQYTEEQYESCRGYGHSTKESGLRLLEMSKAKRIIFTHHDPAHNDDFLDKENERIGNICKDASLAYQTEVINL